MRLRNLWKARLKRRSKHITTAASAVYCSRGVSKWKTFFIGSGNTGGEWDSKLGPWVELSQQHSALRQRNTGGESGIRTHVRVSPKHAFQACAFSHSAISPDRLEGAAHWAAALFYRIVLACRSVHGKTQHRGTEDAEGFSSR